jgi:hypothetical protein
MSENMSDHDLQHDQRIPQGQRRKNEQTSSENSVTIPDDKEYL